MYKFIPVDASEHYYRITIVNPSDHSEVITSVNKSSFSIVIYSMMLRERIKYNYVLEEIDKWEYNCHETISIEKLSGLRFYKKVVEHKTKVVEYDDVQLIEL